mmetsp:Transcript_56502/g.143170  ORF Transcript_56502/g.143170 Transcript_56502/m.143170 type:complete len:219 (-) Transcript_56502:97-753(-)
MLVIGAGWALWLGLANLTLERYAKRYPNSHLARDMHDECDQRLHHYIVPIFTMAVGIVVYVAGCFTNPIDIREWWFGVQQNWALPWATGLGAGHYLQEIITKRCDTLLLLHHVAAIGLCFAVCMATAWTGLLMSWAFVYELGSLLLCLGYVGVAPRLLGHFAAALSSVVGMGFGLHGLLMSRSELNSAVWISIIGLCGLGVGRIQDGVEHIRQLQKRG